MVVRVPVLSPRLSSYWVGLVTPLPIGLARPLIDSLVNEVVVHDDAIRALVPRRCLPLRRAIELALARTRELEVTTSWAEAELVGRGPADPLPTDPHWSGGVVIDDMQSVRTTDAPITDVWRDVSQRRRRSRLARGRSVVGGAGHRRPSARRSRDATWSTPPDHVARR